MLSHLFSFVLLGLSVVCNAQTIYLAGDSTMARGNTVTDGWGQYLSQFVSIPVVNKALGGRSARSFTEEGRFTEIANLAKSGDYVVISFGHNDGSAGAVDNGRQCAVGDGYDTTSTVKTAECGLNVIVSSQTPRNGWVNGSIGAPPRFVGYAKLSAERTSVNYIDHYAYTTVNTYYPNSGDVVHTSATWRQSRRSGVCEGCSCAMPVALKSKVNSAGQSVPDKCL
ncbi:rhamnogalacturonan acetylesterase [Ephemerocybe angulata]|uniref:Rhamnogalacturonan acetylesterase n=1 Tax=Ephemerocybe angulata TaxID=980116 RepID=A0A8H6MH30_9AGAR|nr:rhamnogalacturonan acetylesterase [Tulosesus angulatus]